MTKIWIWMKWVPWASDHYLGSCHASAVESYKNRLYTGGGICSKEKK
jgi:hypothetical protein